MTRYFIIAVFLLLINSSLLGQKRDTVYLSMSLEDAIIMAQQQSLYSFRSKNMYLSRYWEFRSYKAGKLPMLSLGSTPVNYDRSVYVNQDDEFRERASLTSDAALSLRQNLTLTGGVFNITSRLSRVKYLDEDKIKNAYASADLVVARSGSGSVFEIAAVGLPSILIPLPHAAQDHQRENAIAYAKTGAADIMEQNNLKPSLLLMEIEKLFSNPQEMQQMADAAKNFSKPEAAEKIAKEILLIALEHA